MFSFSADSNEPFVNRIAGGETSGLHVSPLCEKLPNAHCPGDSLPGTRSKVSRAVRICICAFQIASGHVVISTNYGSLPLSTPLRDVSKP